MSLPCSGSQQGTSFIVDFEEGTGGNALLEMMIQVSKPVPQQLYEVQTWGWLPVSLVLASPAAGHGLGG